MMLCSGRCLSTRKFAVIGAGGGTGVAAADSCEKAGIPLSNFTPELQQALRSIVPAQGTSVHNPIDLGGPFPPPQMLKAILETVFDSDNIDVIILSEIEMSIMPPFLKVPVSQQVWILANAQMTLDVREKFGKPLIIVLPERSNGIDSLEYECARRRLADFFHKHRVPVFLSLERATKALSKFIGYWERRDSIS